ncbi:MAG: potassium channel family protein [Planctomycetaceae bacterium]
MIPLLVLLFSKVKRALTQHVSFGTAPYRALVTAATVGYGDVTPHDGVGRIMARRWSSGGGRRRPDRLRGAPRLGSGAGDVALASSPKVAQALRDLGSIARFRPTSWSLTRSPRAWRRRMPGTCCCGWWTRSAT